MDLLQEHFARVARALKDGEIVRRGVFFDVAGTLVTGLRWDETTHPPTLLSARDNRLVTRFVRWAAQSSVLDGPMVFSSNPAQALDYLALARIRLEDIGAEKVKDKAGVYRRAAHGFTPADIPEVMIRHLQNSRNFWNPAQFWTNRAQINLDAISETFGRLSRPHKLELVVDDAPAPEHEALAISVWNPKDEDVQAFLKTLLSPSHDVRYERP